MYKYFYQQFTTTMVAITPSKISRNNGSIVEVCKINDCERIFIAEREYERLRQQLHDQMKADEKNEFRKIDDSINNAIDVITVMRNDQDQYPLVAGEHLAKMMADLIELLDMDWISENIQFFEEIKSDVIVCICRTNLNRLLLSPLEELIKNMDKIIEMANRP